MKTGKYIWHTVGDKDVRPEHAARDGKTFSWDSPPEDGYPAQAPGCRCWAEPIDEAAAGLKQEILSPINNSNNKWTTFDFARHFAFGKGRTVTLSEIGYLEDVITISKAQIFSNLEDQITDKMRQIESGPLSYKTDNSYQFSNVHWILGKGVVHTQTVGSIKKASGVLSLDAEVTYNYSDEVTDPIGIRETIRGHHRIHELPTTWQGGTELFVTDLFLGRAYAVKGMWKTRLSGSIPIK